MHRVLYDNTLRPSRRSVLMGAAAVGAGMMMPGGARAQDASVNITGQHGTHCVQIAVGCAHRRCHDCDYDQCAEQ